MNHDGLCQLLIPFKRMSELFPNSIHPQGLQKYAKRLRCSIKMLSCRCDPVKKPVLIVFWEQLQQKEG